MATAYFINVLTVFSMLSIHAPSSPHRKLVIACHIVTTEEATHQLIKICTVAKTANASYLQLRLLYSK